MNKGHRCPSILVDGQKLENLYDEFKPWTPKAIYVHPMRNGKTLASETVVSLVRTPCAAQDRAEMSA